MMVLCILWVELGILRGLNHAIMIIIEELYTAFKQNNNLIVQRIMMFLHLELSVDNI